MKFVNKLPIWRLRTALAARMAEGITRVLRRVRLFV